MENGQTSVLYICHDPEVGGSFLSLSNLIHSVSGKVSPIVLLRRRSEMSEAFEAMGCRVLVHEFKLNVANANPLFRACIRPFRRLRDAWTNTRCIAWVARKLRDVRVDVVHANSSVIAFGGALAVRLGAKHVWHIREIYDLGLHRQPVEGWGAFRRSMFEADALVAISQAVYDRWNMRKHRMARIIPDAVRPASEIASDPSKEKFVLFCSAVLNDSKGADLAAEIFCRSGLRADGFRLCCVGECPPGYRTKLEAIAARHGQDGALEFLGRQGNVKPFMSKAAAFLMCSRYEGLGRVTIEAMFYGCPVLGLDSGGTREIIEDGINGLMFSSVDEAAAKLRLLATDRHLAFRLADAAAEKARKRFSEEACGREILALYRNLLEKRPPSLFPACGNGC